MQTKDEGGKQRKKEAEAESIRPKDTNKKCKSLKNLRQSDDECGDEKGK